MTLDQWFKANPKAAAHARQLTASGVGSRNVAAEMQRLFGCPFGGQTALLKWLRKTGATRAARFAKAAPERFFRSEKEIKALDRSTDIFFTCAVSNSPACKPALRALEMAAAECNGKILVVPIRYKNPTREGEQEDEWWAPEIRPYLLENEVRPHPLLSLMTTKAAATAANPLPTRVNGRTKDRSAIFGHPQLSMRTVATPHNHLPKILYSSGAITEKAYSDTLAGDMADFHHSVAAVKVEVRGNRFHLREIVWDGKRFIDLNRSYTPKGVVDAPHAEALVMGDIHVGLEDPNVMKATFAEGGIIPTLRPKRVVIHDVFDGRSINPHERGRALLEAVRADSRVSHEIESVALWLYDYFCDSAVREVLIAYSNHHEFLRRWLDHGRPSPADAELFHWLSYKMLNEYRRNGEFPDPLEVALTSASVDIPEQIRFLGINESYRVGDCELGQHGHLGPDGARGGLNLSRMGTRGISAHTHSPKIFQGWHWAGLSAVYSHGYNNGPSSWMQAHVALLGNYLRQMIFIVGDRWRG